MVPTNSNQPTMAARMETVFSDLRDETIVGIGEDGEESHKKKSAYEVRWGFCVGVLFSWPLP